MKLSNLRAGKKRWAEGAIVYQIYPRSFYDSNGDGIGDIPGIIDKLDYIKSLNVNAIWLSPFYLSPMADFGYDIADYCSVDPIFGSLDDITKLIKESKRLGIRVVVDLVPNHTSDEHVWFRQSRQSREDKYSDWYIWKDPKGFDKNGKPLVPNNWVEIMTGGSVWEWEPARQQFYLHSFDVRQPDLNWQNEKVHEAIKDVMRFWLDLGTDGFRVDAVSWMAKDPLFRDEPPNPNFKKGKDWGYSSLQHINNQGWPPMYEYLSELASILKEPKYKANQPFMITEAYPQTSNPVDEYLAFYERVNPAVSAPFNFQGLVMPWEAQIWGAFLQKFHLALDEFNSLCVPSYAFGNHDQARMVTRLGAEVARSAAVVLLTLPGMVFIYNGDELGMKNGIIPPEMVQDPSAKGGTNRDPERTPLQWTPGKNAGFSTADKTWLPVADGYEKTNVETESDDSTSFLSLYRKLAELRNSSKALRNGSIEIIETKNPDVLGYIRSTRREQCTVLINYSKQNQDVYAVSVPKPSKLVLSSVDETRIGLHVENAIHLKPNEAIIINGKLTF